MMSTKPPRRILLIEDEPMLAFMLEEFLLGAGYAVPAIATRLNAALRAIAEGTCDAAILDANLAGVSAAPAAAALTARGIPFLVLSGYTAHQQEDAFAGAMRLKKPCPPEKLLTALGALLNGK
jgi:DNA-binding response OmpR family regulator